jgi:hypothetical protein
VLGRGSSGLSGTARGEFVRVSGTFGEISWFPTKGAKSMYHMASNDSGKSRNGQEGAICTILSQLFCRAKSAGISGKTGIRSRQHNSSYCKSCSQILAGETSLRPMLRKQRLMSMLPEPGLLPPGQPRLSAEPATSWALSGSPCWPSSGLLLGVLTPQLAAEPAWTRVPFGAHGIKGLS